jgi:hypothetical protein
VHSGRDFTRTKGQGGGDRVRGGWGTEEEEEEEEERKIFFV